MLNSGTYRVLDWDENNIKLDGGIGWISKDEIDENEIYETTENDCIGTIILSKDISPSYDLNRPYNEISQISPTTQTFGQQVTTFKAGEMLKYQSIQKTISGDTYYSIKDDQNSTCYIPIDYISVDNSFVSNESIEYSFDEVPLFPTSISLTLGNPLYEQYSGYIARANANSFDKNSVVYVEVDGNEALNRYIYILDDDFQGDNDLGILFVNDLDKDYWGKRIIKTTVIEKEVSIEDFRDLYMYKNGVEEVIEFG